MGRIREYNKNRFDVFHQMLCTLRILVRHKNLVPDAISLSTVSGNSACIESIVRVLTPDGGNIDLPLCGINPLQELFSGRLSESIVVRVGS